MVALTGALFPKHTLPRVPTRLTPESSIGLGRPAKILAANQKCAHLSEWRQEAKMATFGCLRSPLPKSRSVGSRLGVPHAALPGPPLQRLVAAPAARVGLLASSLKSPPRLARATATIGVNAVDLPELFVRAAIEPARNFERCCTVVEWLGLNRLFDGRGGGREISARVLL